MWSDLWSRSINLKQSFRGWWSRSLNWSWSLIFQKDQWSFTALNPTQVRLQMGHPVQCREWVLKELEGFSNSMYSIVHISPLRISCIISIERCTFAFSDVWYLGWILCDTWIFLDMFLCTGSILRDKRWVVIWWLVCYCYRRPGTCDWIEITSTIYIEIKRTCCVFSGGCFPDFSTQIRHMYRASCNRNFQSQSLDTT